MLEHAGQVSTVLEPEKGKLGSLPLNVMAMGTVYAADPTLFLFLCHLTTIFLLLDQKGIRPLMSPDSEYFFSVQNK